MRDDAVLLRWLLHVEQDGLCLIDGAPQQQGITRHICDRVAYPKLNYYGLVISTVSVTEISIHFLPSDLMSVCPELKTAR